MICRLCVLLHSLGYHFTIENPKGSFVWLFDPVVRLIEYLGDDCCMLLASAMAQGADVVARE